MNLNELNEKVEHIYNQLDDEGKYYFSNIVKYADHMANILDKLGINEQDFNLLIQEIENKK